MGMAYSKALLEYLQRGITQYEKAFEKWMETQIEGDPLHLPGILPSVFKKDGISSKELQDAEANLAEAAAPAALATKITGAYIAVQGMGFIDPLSNWYIMKMPKSFLTPPEIRTCIGTVRGRLTQMISFLEMGIDTSPDGVPTFSPAAMHPIIWNAAAEQWTIHQYRVAVSESALALTSYWRDKLGRKDVDGAQFWQQSFSPNDPTPEQPRLRWPGEANDRTRKGLQRGIPSLTAALMHLADGLASTSRNVSAHSQDNITEQEAMEQLASYSFLARLLDKCEIITADK